MRRYCWAATIVVVLLLQLSLNVAENTQRLSRQDPRYVESSFFSAPASIRVSKRSINTPTQEMIQQDGTNKDWDNFQILNQAPVNTDSQSFEPLDSSRSCNSIEQNCPIPAEEKCSGDDCLLNIGYVGSPSINPEHRSHFNKMSDGSNFFVIQSSVMEKLLKNTCQPKNYTCIKAHLNTIESIINEYYPNYVLQTDGCLDTNAQCMLVRINYYTSVIRNVKPTYKCKFLDLVCEFNKIIIGNLSPSFQITSSDVDDYEEGNKINTCKPGDNDCKNENILFDKLISQTLSGWRNVQRPLHQRILVKRRANNATKDYYIDLISRIKNLGFGNSENRAFLGATGSSSEQLEGCDRGDTNCTERGIKKIIKEVSEGLSEIFENPSLDCISKTDVECWKNHIMELVQFIHSKLSKLPKFLYDRYSCNNDECVIAKMLEVKWL